jgi:hypothetical protein
VQAEDSHKKMRANAKDHWKDIVTKAKNSLAMQERKIKEKL